MRKLQVGSMIIAVVALGFFREFVFVHINEYLFALWYDEPSRALEVLPFLANFDYYTLYYAKFFLTALFAGLFFLASLITLRLIYAKNYWKLLSVIYAVLFVVAGIAMAVGYLGDGIRQTYPFARLVMGLAQSPLILMVLIPGIWLQRARASQQH
jgi:amino acid permease